MTDIILSNLLLCPTICSIYTFFARNISIHIYTARMLPPLYFCLILLESVSD